MGKYIGNDISYGLFEKQILPVPNPPIDEYYLNHLVSSATSIQVVCERAVLEPNVDYTVRTENGRSILKLNNIDLSNPGDDNRVSLYVVFLGQKLLTPGTGNQDPELVSAIAAKADQSYVDSRINNLVSNATPALDTLNELRDALGNDKDFAVTVATNLGQLSSSISTLSQTVSDNFDQTSSDITDLTNSIQTVETDLAAEVSRAQTAEQANVDQIEAETVRATNAEGAISASLTAETQARIDADVTLQNNIDSVSSSLSTVATSGSYNDLTDKPTIPSLSGYATESYVDTQVSNEASARQTGDTTLQANLDAIESTLSSAIDAEESARISSDDTLSTRIDALEQNASITSLTELSDVSLSATPQTGDLLSYTGTGWTNTTQTLATVATTGSYNDLLNKPTLNVLPSGSVSSPSLYFFGDTNTGLYRKGEDKMGFVANGQPALSIDGTSGVGRLVVGDISSVVSRLQIADDNNNAASGITLGSNASTYVQIYKSASNSLCISANSVGIGTSSPTATLHVNGTSYYAGDVTVASSIISAVSAEIGGALKLQNSSKTGSACYLWALYNMANGASSYGNELQLWRYPTSGGALQTTRFTDSGDLIQNGVITAISNMTTLGDINISGMVVDATGVDVGITGASSGVGVNWLCKLSSSLRYKTNVETILPEYSNKVLDLRPVWYRANTETTVGRGDWSWFGLIAEEVAEIEPRLVNFEYAPEDINSDTHMPNEGAQPRAESVSYSRLSVLLIDVVKRQKQEIADLEERLAILEALVLSK
jgi:hypothetical protein